MSNSRISQFIKQALVVTNVDYIDCIQSLWSGYGEIARYTVNGGNYDLPTSVILKHVKLPDSSNHPRGWNTNRSHQRKIKSYQVESDWYQYYASQCPANCRVPQSFAVKASNNEFLLLMEDLDSAGYSRRVKTASLSDIKLCLNWLAHFHATFLWDQNSQEGNTTLEQLWPIGTYWHLQTRPDELEALTDKKLKDAAVAIDKKLNTCRFKTLVHGDAKLANFCFSENGNHVAAVDFQYVGGGCGMKDVAYFIGSCLYEEDCQKYETELLDYYFQELINALSPRSKLGSCELERLESEWRELFYFAWADFHRFLKGWSPGHWKINGYSERITQQVIESLGG